MDNIKAMRRATGLTQKEFSNKYKIPLQTLKSWEADPGSSNYRKPPAYLYYLLGRLIEIDENAKKEE